MNTDYHNQYTDDENHDAEVDMQLAKERQQSIKSANDEPIKNCPLDENKLKDMGILFGMSQDEVDEVAEQQKKQQQRVIESSILFGETGNEDHSQSH